MYTNEKTDILGAMLWRNCCRRNRAQATDTLLLPLQSFEYLNTHGLPTNLYNSLNPVLHRCSFYTLGLPRTHYFKPLHEFSMILVPLISRGRVVLIFLEKNPWGVINYYYQCPFGRQEGCWERHSSYSIIRKYFEDKYSMHVIDKMDRYRASKIISSTWIPQARTTDMTSICLLENINYLLTTRKAQEIPSWPTNLNFQLLHEKYERILHRQVECLQSSYPTPPISPILDFAGPLESTGAQVGISEKQNFITEYISSLEEIQCDLAQEMSFAHNDLLGLLKNLEENIGKVLTPVQILGVRSSVSQCIHSGTENSVVQLIELLKSFI